MNENKTKEQLLYVLLGAVLFIFFWLCIITGVLFGIAQDTLAVPETEEVIETTESETAPVETVPETSIPETEPTIPTETTEPTEPEVTRPTSIVVPKPEINPDELEMLACVIYQEAGGDNTCDECRRRVADVVLNRVADPRFPDTIYGVLTQPGQYSALSAGIRWPERASNPYEAHAVRRAYRIAKGILMGEHSDLYGKGYIWQATFIQGRDNIYCCGHYYGR